MQDEKDEKPESVTKRRRTLFPEAMQTGKQLCKFPKKAGKEKRGTERMKKGSKVNKKSLKKEKEKKKKPEKEQRKKVKKGG